jgi:hypothetical protein
MVKQKSDEKEFLGCSVHCQIITPEDPKFETIAREMFDEIPKNPNIVIPFFDLSYNNFVPNDMVNMMIQEELDNYVEDNKEIVDIMRRTDPDKVRQSDPIGKPYSKPIKVGDIAITPDKNGIIADFNFDKIISICE